MRAARRRDPHCGVEATVELVDALAPDAVVVATGSVPARPWWAPPPLDRVTVPTPGELPVVDVTDVVTGRLATEGHVIVIDEVGFHQATSVAELLADRGCRVEILSPGMVVGQDLGITLDMENWWLRAIEQGHRAGARLGDRRARGRRPAGAAPPDRGHHAQDRRLGRAGRARRPGRRALLRAGKARYAGGTAVTVERVGDCVAPRRAHAAVIEGNRVGAAL